MAMQATLTGDILKQATSVELEPIGSVDNFEITGGDAYVGRDKFTYTGYTLGTNSYTLLGCVGIDYSHVLGEEVSNHYGFTFSDIAPLALKNNKNDPDGLFDAIFRVLETGMFKELKDSIIDVHKNVDPNRAELLFLKYICSNLGLESNEAMTEAMQRSLARQAANVLSLRGTVNAFKFLAYHILGYQTEVTVNRAKVNLILNNRNYRFYRPPYEMIENDKTVSYWKFSEGSGLTSANEVAGGTAFTLPNNAMWNIDSMFIKDTSIEIDGVHTYIESSGSVISKDNLHGKSAWRLRFMMKPSSWVVNQIVLYKGTMLEISRPSATDLKVTFSDGITTVSNTFTDCIITGQWNYISLTFERPTMSLIVDSEVIDIVTTFDLDTIDDGSSWIFGDKTGVAEYRGLIDTFMVEVGATYLTESTKYFDHIEMLRSFGTDTDRNCYLFDGKNDDGFMTITVVNGDGDAGKIQFLEYLITEWLTVSNYSLAGVAHLPLEIDTLF